MKITLWDKIIEIQWNLLLVIICFVNKPMISKRRCGNFLASRLRNASQTPHTSYTLGACGANKQVRLCGKLHVIFCIKSSSKFAYRMMSTCVCVCGATNGILITCITIAIEARMRRTTLFAIMRITFLITWQHARCKTSASARWGVLWATKRWMKWLR